MSGRSAAVVVGFLGGFLILIGGVIRFLFALAPRVGSVSLSFIGGPLLPLVGTSILGMLVLFTARPRSWWWPGRRIFNGILPVLLGLLGWVFAAGSVVVLFGSLLTIVAGIMLPFEGLVFGGSGLRRLFRRRWF